MNSVMMTSVKQALDVMLSQDPKNWVAMQAYGAMYALLRVEEKILHSIAMAEESIAEHKQVAAARDHPWRSFDDDVTYANEAIARFRKRVVDLRAQLITCSLDIKRLHTFMMSWAGQDVAQVPCRM